MAPGEECWVLVMETGNSEEVDEYRILGVYSTEKAANDVLALLPRKSRWVDYKIEAFTIRGGIH